MVFYKESIERLVQEGKESGYNGIFLKGRSDLDFIVEHSCISNGLDYVRDPDSYVGRLFTILCRELHPGLRNTRNREPPSCRNCL